MGKNLKSLISNLPDKGVLIVFVPLSTLLILIAGAFMVGMLTAFIMVIRAMLRFKK